MMVTYVTGTPRLSVALKKEFKDGKPWSPRIQRFDANGYLVIDEDQHNGKKIIELLDNDKRYGTVYRRLSDSEINAIADATLEAVAHMPEGGITEEMKNRLTYLDEKGQKSAFVPAETKKIIQDLEEVFKAFKIHGIKKPKTDDTARKIKAAIFEVFDVLEKSKIFTVG
jgi:hypothetical protein